MRVRIQGTVVDVQAREWVAPTGEKVKAFDAYLASDNPRYGADRISGPVDLAPEKGEIVDYIASVKARSGSRGPWLSVWVVERVEA